MPFSVPVPGSEYYSSIWSAKTGLGQTLICYTLCKQVDKDSLYEEYHGVKLKEMMPCFCFTDGFMKCRDI